MNIPNTLTFIRITLIPVFVIVFYLPISWAHQITALLFTLAAITDWLDGYLARRLGQTSTFGAFLDPVADKLMVGAALVLIVQVDPMALGAWISIPATVIIGREIAISALREWMAEIGERTTVRVVYVGKIKTVAQMLSIIFLLFQYPLLGIPIYELGCFLLYIAVLLTLWSMVVYLRSAWPALESDFNNSGNGT